MPPPTWASPEQAEFLGSQLTSYLAAKENSKKVPLVRYWNQLEEKWFERWPEEGELELPAAGSGVPLTDDQTAWLGAATGKRKSRLKANMRYRERLHTAGRGHPGNQNAPGQKKRRSLFKILKKPKATRNLQVVEMYQKLHHAKIKAEVMNRGYGDMNEESEAIRAAQEPPAPVVILTPQEQRRAEEREDKLALERVHTARRKRMKLWRATTTELWNEESEDVRQEIEESTADVNKDRAAGIDDGLVDEERTPQHYEHAIEQIGAVYGLVHEATVEEAGWFGMTIVGGPNPVRGGQVSMKVICFGKTPNGNTFEAAHPDFDGQIKSQFARFLKRAFPHNVRDSRALPVAGDATEAPDLEGLLTMDMGTDNEAIPKPTKDTAPKRIRRKKTALVPSTLASTPISSAIPPVAFVTPASTLAPPVPSAAAASPPITPSSQIDATPSYDFSNDDFDFPSLLLNEGSPELLQEHPVNGPPSSPSIFWAGMPPPTSPRTAGMIAGFERGQGTEGMENIDPLLYGVPRQPMYPPARPMYAGAAFEANREVGGSPGARATANVTGFQFPVASSYPRSNLFQAFVKSPGRTSPTTPSSSAPSFIFGSNSSNLNSRFTFASTPSSASSPSLGSAYASVTKATPSALPSARPAQSTDVLTQTTTPIAPHRLSALATFTNALTSATKAVTPARPIPLAPQFPQSRPMANAPKGHPLAVKTGAGKTAKTQTLPAADADADPEPAAGDRDEALPLPAAKRRRGRPRKVPAVVDAPVAAAEDVVAAVPAMTPAARVETARLKRVEAELRQLKADTRRKEKEMDAAAKEKESKEKEARRLKDRLHNPDGDHPLFITGSRPKRHSAAKDYNGDPIERPKKLTRAQIAANKNAPSENALLARTKHVAAGDAGSAPLKKWENT
ncbi:hypothetical protein C8R44DRAFT_892361 [Mycena epipterygia]|nr:hypothetical protein C8R44DRAFT_892361 [Mycena epipterygia]